MLLLAATSLLLAMANVRPTHALEARLRAEAVGQAAPEGAFLDDDDVTGIERGQFRDTCPGFVTGCSVENQ